MNSFFAGKVSATVAVRDELGWRGRAQMTALWLTRRSGFSFALERRLDEFGKTFIVRLVILKG